MPVIDDMDLSSSDEELISEINHTVVRFIKSEETHLKPKPMIEIGGTPILWHIMKQYSQHGINDFIICCGYKGYLIKE